MLTRWLNAMLSWKAHHAAVVSGVGLLGLALYCACSGDYHRAMESLCGALTTFGLIQRPAAPSPASLFTRDAYRTFRERSD